MVSNPTPIAGNLDFELSNVTGRDPVAGEVVAMLDPLTQTYSESYFDGTQWIDQNTGYPSTAMLQVGQAAWFGLGANYDITMPTPVPEPDVLALIGIGAGMLFLRRNQSRTS